jgi:hypothetical protein
MIDNHRTCNPIKTPINLIKKLHAVEKLETEKKKLEQKEEI